MRLILAAAFSLALAAPALAGQQVSLRNDTTASGPITLGDLFDGAGRASGVIVAPAVTSGTVVLDAATVQRAAMNAGLTWVNEQGVRRIVVRPGAPAAAKGAAGNVDVLAFKRALDAGETVAAEDLTWTKAAAAPTGAPRDPDQLIGKVVKRPMREGSIASLRDVSSPIVIKKDDIVTVSYAANGVSVSMQGKAIAAAALGEPVGILNTTTKRTIQAVASGPDQAVVGPQADALRAQALSNSSQLALR